MMRAAAIRRAPIKNKIGMGRNAVKISSGHLSRRALLAGASAVGICAPFVARAQSWPSQDIHFVTGFPPGSGADVITRYFAEKTRVISGKNVIVENKPGAAGSIATEYVARSKPDGY